MATKTEKLQERYLRSSARRTDGWLYDVLLENGEWLAVGDSREPEAIQAEINTIQIAKKYSEDPRAGGARAGETVAFSGCTDTDGKFVGVYAVRASQIVAFGFADADEGDGDDDEDVPSAEE